MVNDPSGLIRAIRGLLPLRESCSRPAGSPIKVAPALAMNAVLSWPVKLLDRRSDVRRTKVH
jgi:hypothetical protein